MKIATTLFLFVVIGCTWREAIGTCVLESDFGFTLNCAFKKSGLFRVRNLGGVKGYVGLGFSVGDELGFRESLSNLESSKRRSVQVGRGNVIPIGSPNAAMNRNDGRQNTQNTLVLPPFKPLPPGVSRPMGQQPERQRLVVQQNVTAPKATSSQDEYLKQQQRMQQEAYAMQVLKQQQLQQRDAVRQQQAQQALAQQNSQLQAQQALLQQNSQLQAQQLSQQQKQQAAQQQNVQQQIIAMQNRRIQVTQAVPDQQRLGIVMEVPNMVNAERVQQLPKPTKDVPTSASGLPPFVAMPKSSAQLTDRISNSATLLDDSVNEVPNGEFHQVPIPSDEAVSTVNQLTLRSIQPSAAAQSLQNYPQLNSQSKSGISHPVLSVPSLASIQSMEPSLKALAAASNVTLEALETAILLRQQQLMQRQQQQPATTTTTTSTTTQATVKHRNNFAAVTKVMNAPREYYPVGYDKNFDDNFASRVDLPDTSFYCGDQKHFPGLYADEDLGCMVFHICALTDDGLIMKSFLCPESTLFDQTILKCNWWFYVDCKSSRKLYDSNIPISKSYQLMKALAFFSAYKNHDNSTVSTEENQKS